MGIGATVHSFSRMEAVSGRKSGSCARVELLLADAAAREQLLAARLERGRELGKELAGFARENSAWRPWTGPSYLSTVLWKRPFVEYS